MPTTKKAPKEPHIQVDPLDLKHKTEEEHIQLAIEAIQWNGFTPSGKLWLPLWVAAQAFEVKRATLAAQFNGHKTRKEAHESEKALSFAEERMTSFTPLWHHYDFITPLWQHH